MINRQNQCGYTLVEMMITVAIAGILLAAAVPAFNMLYSKNVSIAYANDLTSAFFHAQNEAVERNIQVTIKPKTVTPGNNLWQNGWDIFEDKDGDMTQDGGDELISTYTPSSSNYTLNAENSAYNSSLAFNSSGQPVDSSGALTSGSFRICSPSSDTALSRTISFTFSGNIAVSKGSSACP